MKLRDTTVDTAMYFLLGLLFLSIGAALLTIAEYNFNHVYLSTDLGHEEPYGFGAWCTHVLEHREQLRAFVRMYWMLDLGWTAFALVIAVSAGPVLAILMLWDKPSLQRAIVLTLIVASVPDLLFLMLFDAAGSSAGGYEGAEGIMLRLLHCLYGLLIGLYALGCTAKRWFGRLFGNPAPASME